MIIASVGSGAERDIRFGRCRFLHGSPMQRSLSLLGSFYMTWAGQPVGVATNTAPALLADLAVEAG